MFFHAHAPALSFPLLAPAGGRDPHTTLHVTAGVHWGYEETKAFLTILSESPFSEKLRTCHQNSQVYRAIAERLCAQGFLRTLEQCRYRFKNLLRSYRKAKSSHPPGTCPFYEELDSLMRARTAVRDMGTGREAAGLPTSDQSSTQVVSQEAWDLGRPQTTSTRLYAGGELQGSPVWQALAGHKRRIPLAVVPE